VRVKKILLGKSESQASKGKEGKICMGKREQVEAGNGYAIGIWRRK
jgi:hypothetical protein